MTFTTNDTLKKELVALGYSNLYSYLKTSQLKDGGSFNDLLFSFLRGKGLHGSLTDMLAAWDGVL